MKRNLYSRAVLLIAYLVLAVFTIRNPTIWNGLGLLALSLMLYYNRYLAICIHRKKKDLGLKEEGERLCDWYGKSDN